MIYDDRNQEVVDAMSNRSTRKTLIFLGITVISAIWIYRDFSQDKKSERKSFHLDVEEKLSEYLEIKHEAVKK